MLAAAVVPYHSRGASCLAGTSGRSWSCEPTPFRRVLPDRASRRPGEGAPVHAYPSRRATSAAFPCLELASARTGFVVEAVSSAFAW